MSLSRLLAPLLLLAPLSVAGASTVTAAGVDDTAEVRPPHLGGGVAPARQPALPALSGAGTLLQVVDATTRTRSTIRVSRHSAESSSAAARPSAAHSSSASHRQLRYLTHVRRGLHARTNLPVTYSNPPPASRS